MDTVRGLALLLSIITLFLCLIEVWNVMGNWVAVCLFTSIVITDFLKEGP